MNMRAKGGPTVPLKPDHLAGNPIGTGAPSPPPLPPKRSNSQSSVHEMLWGAQQPPRPTSNTAAPRQSNLPQHYGQVAQQQPSYPGKQNYLPPSPPSSRPPSPGPAMHYGQSVQQQPSYTAMPNRLPPSPPSSRPSSPGPAMHYGQTAQTPQSYGRPGGFPPSPPPSPTSMQPHYGNPSPFTQAMQQPQVQQQRPQSPGQPMYPPRPSTTPQQPAPYSGQQRYSAPPLQAAMSRPSATFDPPRPTGALIESSQPQKPVQELDSRVFEQTKIDKYQARMDAKPTSLLSGWNGWRLERHQAKMEAAKTAVADHEANPHQYQANGGLQIGVADKLTSPEVNYGGAMRWDR